MNSKPDDANEPDTPPSQPGTNDRHAKTVVAWKIAKLYCEDSGLTKAFRKPRLPIPLINALAEADISFEGARSALGVSSSHLRTACLRAGRQLRSSEAKAPIVESHPKVPQINVTMQEEPIVNANKTEDRTPKISNKTTKRGSELRDRIQTIAREIEEREGSPPTYVRIHREHGFAMKTIAKYLPRRPQSIDRKEASVNKFQSAEAEVQTPEVMAQMVSELVFGCDLVPGTFLNDQGVLRCDGVTESAEGMEPMVQRWRRHEAEVAQILLVARQLA